MRKTKKNGAPQIPLKVSIAPRNLGFTPYKLPERLSNFVCPMTKDYPNNFKK